MALVGLYSATTRIADLDSQRHVSNRVYEQFCAEGRYRLLEQHGWSLETLLARGVTLRPAATYVKFHRQQRAGAALTVETTAYPAENGVVVWDHSIRQDDGEQVCQVQALTSVIGRD
ncbi:MAG: acyl-CoA thioesterase, partial [Anaerolineae bacterium]|nr:acyl-CoA thioesterase [Anaerolineae bacterium]